MTPYAFIRGEKNAVRKCKQVEKREKQVRVKSFFSKRDLRSLLHKSITLSHAIRRCKWIRDLNNVEKLMFVLKNAREAKSEGLFALYLFYYVVQNSLFNFSRKRRQKFILLGIVVRNSYRAIACKTEHHPLPSTDAWLSLYYH